MMESVTGKPSPAAALSVDYAIAPYGALGMGHQLSLGWNFGREEVRPVLPQPRLRK
ncbi:MAG: hypothetical protein FD126_3210 [Elusimicrobia bacterium]|nr:MAG: hypothetical protein FD126_3210 [Elusimicrobiota bacterium]